MQSKASIVDKYINEISDIQKKDALIRLRNVILENIPEGFQEQINYGMIGYVVPHEIYPAGYHCKPEDPLPFLGLACQKNAVTFYHTGLYQDNKLSKWFLAEYTKGIKHKPDMGKSCIRFKYFDEIPYELISELVSKISVQQWIKIYETEIKH